jgi:hypothetical protein
MAGRLIRNRKIADLSAYLQGHAIGALSDSAPDAGADVHVLKLFVSGLDGDASANLDFVGVIGVEVQRVLA